LCECGIRSAIDGFGGSLGVGRPFSPFLDKSVLVMHCFYFWLGMLTAYVAFLLSPEIQKIRSFAPTNVTVKLTRISMVQDEKTLGNYFDPKLQC
jgi:hypothetical protein